MSDVPLSTSRRVKVCFFQHIISPKKPILHKKKKSTGVGAVFQSVKFLILLQEPREKYWVRNFPKCQNTHIVKREDKVTDFPSITFRVAVEGAVREVQESVHARPRM